MQLRARFTVIFFAAALLCSSPVFAQAPQKQTPQPQTDGLPPEMGPLAAHASFHTDFTFDKSMLDMANNFTSDDQVRQVVAKLRAVTVHSYKYPAPGLYDPAALEAVRTQYTERGWKHLVATQPHAASEHPSRTDLWIRFDHGNVEGMVVLLSNPTNINLVNVDGTISPIDLLHLRGHFGIPRFSGDNFEDTPH
jgi:hypothetical protein